jgi:hypothetical protein
VTTLRAALAADGLGVLIVGGWFLLRRALRPARDRHEHCRHRLARAHAELEAEKQAHRSTAAKGDAWRARSRDLAAENSNLKAELEALRRERDRKMER